MMTRLQFDIPDYTAALGWDPGANVRRQIALSMAEAHARGVEEEAKAGSPLRTGRLRGSIRAYPLDERRGVLEATAPHSKYLHEGTGIYGPKRKPIVIEPRGKKALAWPGARHPVKRVRQRGIRPNEFLREAISQSRTETRLRMELESAMRQAQAEAEYAAMENARSNDTDASGSGGWTDYWNWGELGDDLAQRYGNFFSGFGDTITFGITGKIRQWGGFDHVVDRSSWNYKGGEWTGIAWEFAFGGAGMGKSFIKTAGTEWSHWIPLRYIKKGRPYYKPWLDNNRVARWFIRSRFNRNAVSPKFHYLTDDFRYPKGMKALYKKWPHPAQQIGRIPGWIPGSIYTVKGFNDLLEQTLFEKEEEW